MLKNYLRGHKRISDLQSSTWLAHPKENVALYDEYVLYILHFYWPTLICIYQNWNLLIKPDVFVTSFSPQCSIDSMNFPLYAYYVKVNSVKDIKSGLIDCYLVVTQVSISKCIYQKVHTYIKYIECKHHIYVSTDVLFHVYFIYRCLKKLKAIVYSATNIKMTQCVDLLYSYCRVN